MCERTKEIAARCAPTLPSSTLAIANWAEKQIPSGSYTAALHCGIAVSYRMITVMIIIMIIIMTTIICHSPYRYRTASSHSLSLTRRSHSPQGSFRAPIRGPPSHSGGTSEARKGNEDRRCGGERHSSAGSATTTTTTAQAAKGSRGPYICSPAQPSQRAGQRGKNGLCGVSAEERAE